MNKNKQCIIYLHGFRSNENGQKVTHLKNFFPNYNIIGLAYEPHKPVQAAKAITNSIKEIGASNIKGFVGTSLGGFWARWVAAKHNINTVAINPSLSPWKTLKTGTFSKFDSNLNIEVTKEDLEVYPQYSVGSEEVNQSVLHIFALDDELLDSKASMEIIGKPSLQKLYETGGHRFENFERLNSPIAHHIYQMDK